MYPSDLLTIFALSCTTRLIAPQIIRSPLDSLLRDHDRIHKDDVVVLPSYGNYRKLQFEILNKKLSLHVKPNTEIFASHFKVFIENGDGSRRLHTEFDPGQFYEGYIEGESESHVAAHVDDEGIITATMSFPHDTYVIEPSWRHVPVPHNYHMIAYRRSDIKLQLGKRFNNGSYSGKFCHSEGHIDENTQFVHSEFPAYRESLIGHLNVGKKLRRSIPVLNTCEVILVADYSFYKDFGDSDVSGTVHYMVSSIINVNNIFRKTRFSDEFEGMGMHLSKVIVHETPNATNARYNNYKLNWKVSDKLSAFSESTEWQEACLAHLFTYRDFDDGVLGLAYVASPQRSTVGGICSPLYRGFRSLRVGLTTPVNYKRNLLREEVDVVTAHEFGHNWGSPHDPTVSSPNSNCDGEAEGGRFLMYPSAQDGKKLNNGKFSTCSTASIGNVLKAKSSECFSRSIGKLCGNFVVEEDEECDAGFDGDKCCNTDCQFIPPAICSDANSMCCSNCDIAPRSKRCRGAADNNLDCASDTYCTGETADCPKEAPKQDDGATCGSGGTCKNGTCQHVCVRYGMVSCECVKANETCLVCCKANNPDITCSPLQLNVSINASSSMITMERGDGSYCNNFQGTCSAGKCEDLVQDVLDRFWNAITNIDLDRIAEWFRDNIVAAVLIFSLIVWIPASLTIHYFDRKRIRHIKEAEDEYRNARDPEYRVKLQSTGADKWAVKHTRKPSKRSIDEKPFITSGRERGSNRKERKSSVPKLVVVHDRSTANKSNV